MKKFVLPLVAICFIGALYFLREARVTALVAGLSLTYFWLLRAMLHRRQRQMAAWHQAQREFSMRHPILSMFGIGYEKPTPLTETMVAGSYFLFIVLIVQRLP